MLLGQMMVKKLVDYFRRYKLKKADGDSVFVVQQHAARTLHYDFRLEINRMMKSWAIPKGPSLDPRVRRLAILTEDHLLSYNDFEGRIPEGEYGGGAVLIWDRGNYQNIKQDDKGQLLSMQRAFERGTIEIFLKGKKLKGGFALIHLKDKNWLLIKMKDEFADIQQDIVTAEPRSIKTGRIISEI